MRISDWSSDVCSSDLPDLFRCPTRNRCQRLRKVGCRNKPGMTGCFDAIVPITRVDVDRTDLDAALLARVADDLGGGVETQRLRLEERSGEYRRLMAFWPGRNIHQPPERKTKEFGKAI